MAQHEGAGNQREAVYVGGGSSAGSRQRRRQDFNLMAEDVKAVLEEPLEYEVVYKPLVRIRELPSRHVRAMGRVRHGAVLRGFPAGNWLRITGEELGRFQEEGDEPFQPEAVGWILIDGFQLGKGSLLTPKWAAITVTASFSQAIELSWPGAKCDDVTYYVQWVPCGEAAGGDQDADDYGSDGSASDGVESDSEDEELNFGEDGEVGESSSTDAKSAGGHVVSTSPKALLHRLPVGARISIRVVARISGIAIDFEERDVISSWTEVETAPALDEYEQLLNEDPQGERRGRCARTDCAGYVSCNDATSTIKDLCRRCGASYDEHEILAAEARPPVNSEKMAEADTETIANDDDSSDADSEDQDEEEAKVEDKDEDQNEDEADREEIGDEQDEPKLEDSDEESDSASPSRRDSVGPDYAADTERRQSFDIAEDEMEEWRRSIAQESATGQMNETVASQPNFSEASPAKAEEQFADFLEASPAGSAERERPTSTDGQVLISSDIEGMGADEDEGGMSFTMPSSVAEAGDTNQAPASSTVDESREELAGESDVIEKLVARADELADFFGDSLKYEVLPMVGSLEVRAAPHVEAAVIGAAEPGDVLQGFPAGEWFQVVAGDGSVSWVLADGSAFGLGMLLECCWARITFRHITADTVDVEWPGLTGKSSPLEHCIEWRHVGSDHICRVNTVDISGSRPTAVLNDLPEGAQLQLRVRISFAMPVLSSENLEMIGAWYDFATLPGIKDDRGVDFEPINEESGEPAETGADNEATAKLDEPPQHDVRYVVVGEFAAFYSEFSAAAPRGFLQKGMVITGRECRGWLRYALPALHPPTAPSVFPPLPQSYFSLNATLGVPMAMQSEFPQHVPPSDLEPVGPLPPRHHLDLSTNTSTKSTCWVAIDNSLALLEEHDPHGEDDYSWAGLFVINRFSQALHVRWQGLGHNAIKYDLHWKQNMSTDEAEQCFEYIGGKVEGLTEPSVLLQKLPEAASLQLRVAAHCPPRAPTHPHQRCLLGPWVTKTTSKLLPAGEAVSIGPDGGRRGRCRASGCPSFCCLLEDDDPFAEGMDASFCARCGLPFHEHDLLEASVAADDEREAEASKGDQVQEEPEMGEHQADVSRLGTLLEVGQKSEDHEELEASEIDGKSEASQSVATGHSAKDNAVPLPTDATSSIAPSEPQRLEEVMTEAAAAEAAAAAAAKLTACNKGADNSSAVLRKPLVYEVLKKGGAAVRSEPRGDARQLYLSPNGSELHGFPGQGWLRLERGGSLSSKYAGAWIFIGAQLGVACMRIEVMERYAEALQVSWPGIPAGTSVYSVEWKQAPKEAGAEPQKGHVLSLKSEVIAAGLPTQEPVQVRVTARVSAGKQGVQDIQVYGPWTEAVDLRPLEYDVEDMPDLRFDPFSEPRGKCIASNCRGFVISKPTQGRNALGSPNCARCGYHCNEHERQEEKPSTSESVEPSRKQSSSGSLDPFRDKKAYRVAIKNVRVRDAPSTRGKVVGSLVEGVVVHGAVRGKWLHFSSVDMKNVKGATIFADQSSGWLLIDGAELGLGQLLVPHNADTANKDDGKKNAQLELLAAPSSPSRISTVDKASMSSKLVASGIVPGGLLSSGLLATVQPEVKKYSEAPAQAASPPQVDSAAKLAMCKAGVDNSKAVLKDPLLYEVTKAEGAHVREEPRPTAVEVCLLPLGATIYGFSGGGWLQLQKGESMELPGQAIGAWVFVGTQLAARCLMINVLEIFSEALEISWPGLPSGRSAYSIEWKETHKEEGSDERRGHTVCMKPQALINDMPASRAVSVRVIARVSAGDDQERDCRVFGPWTHTTLKQKDYDDDNNSTRCLDWMSTPRGKCTSCSCDQFFRKDAEVNLNSFVGPGYCVRCGHSAASHEVRRFGDEGEAKELLPVGSTATNEASLPSPSAGLAKEQGKETELQKAEESTSADAYVQVVSDRKQPTAVSLAAAARKVLSQPLRYCIVGIPHGTVDARLQPDLESEVAKSLSLSVGRFITGYPAGNWICIMPEELWVHVPEGQALEEENVPAGRGASGSPWLQVEPLWAKLNVEKSFAEAVDLRWPGLPKLHGTNRAAYSVEWQIPSRKDNEASDLQEGHMLTLAPKAVLHRLPAGHPKLWLRVAVRVSSFGGSGQTKAEDARFLGPWTAITMDEPITPEEETGPVYVDADGVPRGACAASGCARFIPEKLSGSGLPRCRRCGVPPNSHQRQRDYKPPAESNAEHEKVEPEKVELEEAKHDKADPEKAEPHKADPEKAEPDKTEPDQSIERENKSDEKLPEIARGNSEKSNEPSVYTVIHKVVFARKAPRVGAEVAGTLVKGQEILGSDVNGWLRVDKTLGMRGRAWVLIDGTGLGQGLGLLLKPMSSLPEWQNLGSIPCDWWSAKQSVLIRKEPSLYAALAGHLVKGQKVFGRKVRDWLEIGQIGSHLSSHPLGQSRWVLIKGSLVGFGTLLEKLDGAPKSSAPSQGGGATLTPEEQAEYLSKKRELEQKAFDNAPAVEKSARIAKMVLGSPLVYRVVNVSPLYDQPMPQAGKSGELDTSFDFVHGYPGSVAWIRVDSEDNDGLPSGWLPVREQGPGREQILHAVWKDVKVVKPYMEALSVQWPGVDNPSENYTLTYSVEWRTPQERAPPLEGYMQSSRQVATLHGLPAGEKVQVRVSLRVTSTNADFRLMGTWQDFETAEKSQNPPKGNGSNSDYTRTGGCAQSQCSGFVPDNRNSRAGPNLKCFRCGERADAHARQAAAGKGDDEKVDDASEEVHNIMREAASNADVLGTPLEYKVAAGPSLEMYRKPSLTSKSVLSTKHANGTIEGYPGGDWLRVDQKPGSDPVWVRTASGSLNRSTRLVPMWANYQVVKRYAEALELTWPGLSSKRAAYSIEWKVDNASKVDFKSATSGHTLSLEPKVLLHKLPADTVISLRVSARIAADSGGDVKLNGTWRDVRTNEAIDAEWAFEQNLHFDPFFVERGGCAATGCIGYICPSKDLHPNGSVKSWSCQRCGKGHEAHTRIEGVAPSVQSTPATSSKAETQSTASAANALGIDLVKRRQHLESIIQMTSDVIEWEVIHTAVYIRSRPDRSGPLLGTVKKGQIVSGVPADGWVQLDASSLKDLGVRSPTGYLLINGKEVGLGILLAPTGAVPTQRQRSEKNVVDALEKGLQEVRRLIPDGLRYTTVCKGSIPCYASPKREPPISSYLQDDTIILGWPVQDWVYMEKGWIYTSHPGGSEESVLKPHFAEVVADACCETALKISWPGLPVDSVTYAVEWRTSGLTASRGDVVISKTTVKLLENLPAKTTFRVRIRANCKGVKFCGEWAYFQTLEEDGTLSNRDPDNQLRFACVESNCKRYKNMGAPNYLCRACGKSYELHRKTEANAGNRPTDAAGKKIGKDKKSFQAPREAALALSKHRLEELQSKGLINGDLFEVVHSAVYVRVSATTSGEQLGMLARGTFICGTAGNGWVCLDPYYQRLVPSLSNVNKDSRSKKTRAGWILIDGKNVGLGQLLRPCNRDTSKTGATPADIDKEERKHRLWQVLTRRAIRTEKLIGFGGPLIFSVASHSPAVMLDYPSNTGRTVQTFPPKADIKGYPCGNWVRVVEKDFGSQKAAIPQGWVKIEENGEQILDPAWASIIVKSQYLEALDIKWPGVPTKAQYAIEWRPVGGSGGGHILSAFKSKLIYGLPASSTVRLRVLACVPAPVGSEVPTPVWLTGRWCEAQTLAATTKDDNKDPSGKARGACEKSGCRQYCAPDQPVIRDPHTNPVSVYICQRCGIQMEDHQKMDGNADGSKEETQHPIHILDLDLPKDLARTSYKVLQKVMVRSGPTIEAERICAFPAGLVVHGLEYNGWIRVDPYDVDNIFSTSQDKPKSTRLWACMSGQAWGCGQLIVQCAGERDAEEIDLASGSLLASELGIINSNIRDIFSKALEFQVVAQHTVVREQPSFRAKVLELLNQSDRVYGYPWNGWLQLDRRVMEDPIGWVHIRELESGTGPILKSCGLKAEITKAFAEALSLTWQLLPAKYVKYSLQWTLKDKDRSQQDLRSGPLNLKGNTGKLNGLPSETLIFFRVVGKVFLSERDMDSPAATPTMIVGDWCSGTTGRRIMQTDIERQHLEAWARNRGRCADCNCCTGFIAILTKFNDNVNTAKQLCRRCGCSCDKHELFSAESRRNTYSGNAYQGAGQGTSRPSGGRNFAAPASPVTAAQLDSSSMTWSVQDEEAKQSPAQYVIKMVAKARTHYEKLGMKPSSPTKELRNAYRQISLKVHPDKVRNTDSSPEVLKNAEATFKLVAGAYEILGDEGKRAAYDKTLRGKTLTPVRKGDSQKGGGAGQSASPPSPTKSKDMMTIKVIHAVNRLSVDLAVEVGILGKDLKAALCKKVRRGPANFIDLATVLGTTISDKTPVRKSDSIYCIGINLGPPKKIKIKVRDLKTGVHMFLEVLDNVTILDVTEKVAGILSINRRHIKLGGWRSATSRQFGAYDLEEPLGGRTELIVQSVGEGAMFFSIEQGMQVQDDLIEVYTEPEFQKALDDLLKKFPAPGCLANTVFRNQFSNLVQARQKSVCEKWGYTGNFTMGHMMSAFTQIGWRDEVTKRTMQLDLLLRVTQNGLMPYDPKIFEQQKGEQKKKKTQTVEDVTIVIRPAKLEGYERGSLKVTVKNFATFGMVKAAIAAKVPGVDMATLRLVFTQKARATGAATYASFRDSEKIGHRRQMLALGLQLPDSLSESKTSESPGKTEATSKRKASVEVNVKVQELNGSRSIEIRAFTTTRIYEVKQAVEERLSRADLFQKGATLNRRDNRGLTAPWGDGEMLGSNRVFYLRDATLEHKNLLEYDEQLESERVGNASNQSMQVIHAIDGDSLFVPLPSGATMGMIKPAIARLYPDSENVGSGRLVRRMGGEFVDFEDTTSVGGRRKVLFLGPRLSSQGLGGSKVEDRRVSVKSLQEAENSDYDLIEVIIKCQESDQEVSLEIRRSTSIGALKVALARWLGRPDLVQSARFVMQGTSMGLAFFSDADNLGKNRTFRVMCSDLTPAPDSPAARNGGGARVSQQIRRAKALLADEALELLGELKMKVNKESFQAELANLESAGQETKDMVKKALEERTQAAFAAQLTRVWGPTLVKFGYGADESGFHEMFTAVSALHRNVSVRRLVFAIERLLRMMPGDFFGLKPREEEKQAPTEIQVRVRHALDGDDVLLAVMSDSTMRDVLVKLANHFKRREVLEKGRLVRDKGGTYIAYDPEAFLGKRRKLLFMGAPLGMVEEAPEDDEQAPEEDEERKEDPGDEPQSLTSGLLALEPGGTDDHSKLETHGQVITDSALDNQLVLQPVETEFQELTPADDDRIEVRVKLAGGGGQVEVKTYRTSSLRDVREALAEQLNRPNLIDDFRFASYGDDELLGEKRRLLLIEASPPTAMEEVVALPEVAPDPIVVSTEGKAVGIMDGVELPLQDGEQTLTESVDAHDAPLSPQMGDTADPSEEQVAADTSSEQFESESDVEDGGQSANAHQVATDGPKVLVVAPDASTMWQLSILKKLLDLVNGEVLSATQWQTDSSHDGDAHIVQLASLDPSSIAEASEAACLMSDLSSWDTQAVDSSKCPTGLIAKSNGDMPLHVEVEVNAVADGARIWVSVPEDGTIKQVKEAIAIRCDDLYVLQHIRLVRQYSPSMFLPFGDAEVLGKRRKFLLMGVNIMGVAPRAAPSPVAGTADSDLNGQDQAAGSTSSGCEAAALLIAAMELFEDATVMKALMELDMATGGTLASWEPPWEAEGLEDLDGRSLSMKPQRLVRAWAENFAGIIDSLAHGLALKRGEATKSDALKLKLKHAVTGRTMTVSVPVSATMAQIREAACDQLGLSAHSTDMTLLRRTKNSLTPFSESDQVNRRKKLLVAGVDFESVGDVTLLTLWVRNEAEGDTVVVKVPNSATVLDVKKAVIEQLGSTLYASELKFIKNWNAEGDHIFHRDMELLVNKTHVLATGITFKMSEHDVNIDSQDDELGDEDVEVRLEHAETKKSMSVIVPGYATMWDVKEAAALDLGIGNVSSILLVSWTGPHNSVLACYGDDTLLGLRRKLLLLGADIGQAADDVGCAETRHDTNTGEPPEVEAAGDFENEENDDEVLSERPADAEVREHVSDDEVISEPCVAANAQEHSSDDEVISEPSADAQQQQQAGDEFVDAGMQEQVSDDEVVSDPPGDAELLEQADGAVDVEPAELPATGAAEEDEEVIVVLEHAETGNRMSVSVPSSCIMLEVKEALLCELGCGEASNVRLVKWSGPYKTVLSGYANDARLGRRRHLLVLGVDIPAGGEHGAPNT